MDILPRTQGSRNPKVQEVKTSGFNQLRQEAGSRAKVLVGIGDIAGVEHDLAFVEEEVRSVREIAIGIRRELVSGTIDPEIVVVLETFRMCQEHNPDREGAKTELAGVHHFARPTDRTARMTLAELDGNNQDVRTALRFGELAEELLRASQLTQVLRTELATVVELAAAGLADHGQHLCDCFAVGRGNLFPPWNGEPPFGVRGKRLFGQLLIGGADAREELTQDVGLLNDTLRLVAREIPVVGLNFLVDVTFTSQFANQPLKLLPHFIAFFDNALGTILTESNGVKPVLYESDNLFSLTFSCGDQCF